jgi:hypothetical protein
MRKKAKLIKEQWLHVRVDAELLKALEELAATETRTVSNLIRVLLQEAIEQRKGGRR